MILVTNDDGIYAPGLWALVGELKKFNEVMVVAPDREQSAIGTAITLHHPLRVQKVKPEIPGVETYSVGGTPGDSTILAISYLAKDSIDLVISGINNGPNMGDDVFISGTVGGAMQAYLHGLSAIAVSVDELDGSHFEDAAVFAARLTGELNNSCRDNFFLNINIPGLPAGEIKGVKNTRLSTTGYADTVEEGYDGRRHYYWLKHQKVETGTVRQTDAWAVAHHQISITPLHTYLFGKTIPLLDENLRRLCRRFRE